MKAPGQRTSKPSPKRDQRHLVEQLTAAGLNGDVVSQILNVNKNKLRREHAMALYSGRREAERQKAAEAAASGCLTNEEKHAANVIIDSFASGEWIDPVCGSLLWFGLDSSGAKTAAEAFAAWLRDGARFITTGLDGSFSPERIDEIVALKIEAKRLLGALEHRRRRGEAEHHT
jgi:hypothetical protein